MQKLVYNYSILIIDRCISVAYVQLTNQVLLFTVLSAQLALTVPI